MPRPLPLLSLFLLALLTTEIPAAYAQKSRQVKPAPPPKPALRLVVQQGMSNVSHGFIIFSPDGRLVATGHNGGDVVVWDVASGREVRRLRDNSGDPGAQDVDGWLWGAFSPDGRLLATSVGPNLRLWDLWTGQRLWLATHADHAFFTPPEADGRPPDGERVLVATANNGGNTRQMLVKVYDVDAGSAEGTLRRPGFRVDSFAWTPVIRRRACRARASSRGRWGVGA